MSKQDHDTYFARQDEVSRWLDSHRQQYRDNSKALGTVASLSVYEFLKVYLIVHEFFVLSLNVMRNKLFKFDQRAYSTLSGEPYFESSHSHAQNNPRSGFPEFDVLRLFICFEPGPAHCNSKSTSSAALVPVSTITLLKVSFHAT